VGPAEKFGEDDSGLRVSVVVRLQAGKNQVELLVFDCGGESFCGVEGVEADEGIVLQMNRAVGAFCQCLPQNLRGSRGAGRDYDDFSAMLLFLAQRFFERVGIRFVDFVGNVLGSRQRFRSA
jgi:hypothetical protein